MPADLDRLRDLFLAAIELAAPDRPALLDRECAGDAPLRCEVERLLAAHSAVGPLDRIGPPDLPATADAVPPPDSCGTLIGAYKLLEQIGEGGFGTVFLAEQKAPVRRRVALKVVKAGMDTGHVVARFEAERQALAMMDHPNIARVFDGGTTESGRPYFVMELVRGVPITQFCEENELPLAQRLELFIAVCGAVQHAHHKGIIHRDLKPSNILVSRHDTTPVVKVIDFGIAKAIGERLTDKTLFTGLAQMIGTPLYMSPEQAGMSDLDVDTRSDVYSLGVVLYELLTGTTPFQKERFQRADYDEIRRIIREEEPPKPSTRLLQSQETLASAPASRNKDPHRWTKQVERELDWIVMKALEKDRTRRYESSAAFARDVERYLADEPVQACPPSLGYRLGKLGRRHRGPVLAVAAVMLALVVGLIGTTWGMVRAERAKRDVEAEAEKKTLALAEAEANLALAQRAVNEIYEPVAGQLSSQPHLRPYQRDILEKALGFYEEFARRNSRDPAIRRDVADAALRVLSIKWNLGQRERYERRCREIIADLEQLAVELPTDKRRRQTLAGAHNFLGNLLRANDQDTKAEASFRQALAIYSELADESPDNPTARFQVVGNLNSLGASVTDRPEKAESYHRESIRLCEEMAKKWPGDPRFRSESMNGYSLVGYSLARAKRPTEAKAAYRRAIEDYDAMATSARRINDRFTVASSLFELGRLLQAEQRFAEAEAAYRRAVALAEEYSAQNPHVPAYRRNVATFALTLCALLRETNQPEQAAPFARLGREMITKLSTDSPDETRSNEQAIADLRNWGANLRDANEPKEAILVLRRAVAMARELVKESPDDVGCLSRLAQCLQAEASTLQRARRHGEAANAFREVLAIRAQIAKAHPTEPERQWSQANSANFLGIALRRARQFDESARSHREAIALCERLAAAHPDRPTYRSELVRGHYALGLTHWSAGRIDRAKASLEQALVEAAALPRPAEPSRIDDPRLPAPRYFEPLVPSVQNSLAWLLATCADEKHRDPRRAVELARLAVEGDPQPASWNTLGAASYRVGRFEDALAALNESMAQTKGGSAFDWFFVAMAHQRRGDSELARRWYDKAVAWMAKRPANDELRRFRDEAARLLGTRPPDSEDSIRG